jgi:hypothetical protein
MAEEMVQSYLNLAEVVRQFSVKDIDLLHKERWKELIIKKSEFNRLPFLFGSNAVFGSQPASDLYYSDKLFRFGFPKEAENAYSFKPSFNIEKFGAISNRIISPSLLLIPGVDVVVQDGVLVFNLDLFNNPNIPKAKLVTDDGEEATFVDSAGNTVPDEFVVLWMYHVEQDLEQLYQNFGVLFDLYLPTSKNYKELLKAIINLSVEGPTISSLNSAFAALMDIPVVIEPVEIVEDVYDLAPYSYVITDKNAYRMSIELQIDRRVCPGAELYAGDTLVTNMRLIDTVTNPVWWLEELRADKLGFASHIFASGAKNQLFFENKLTLISYIRDNLYFPILGDADDVATFQSYINEPDNKAAILEAFGIPYNHDTTLPINPVDFVFKNIFKNNTLLLKLDFYSQEQFHKFFNLLPVIRTYLSPHVYILTYINLSLDVDVLTNLNSALHIPGFEDQSFSMDGSVSSSGARPGYFEEPDYYKDYVNRLFCISKGPLKNNQPLQADGSSRFDNVTNILDIAINNDVNEPSGIKAGTLRTPIPELIKPVGELTWRRPTTRDIPSILLIDF